MRTIEYGTPAHVPAFLTKLWKLVTDESCDELICWSAAGTSFIIYDEIRFSKELLPMYFKHNNMASFVRQLNMYGFRKLSCIDQGGMHCYRSEIEFYHQYFLKGQESLLELIKRKIPSSKSEEPKKQEYIEELKTSIKILKEKADFAEQNVRKIGRENRVLWKHVGMLTEQYSKQQAMLQQFLPFFVNGMCHHLHREIPLKRKAHLMIDEGSLQAKLPRLASSYYVEHNDQEASLPSSPSNVTNRGPVIHDVTELESSKMFPANVLCSPNSPPKENEAIVDSPLSCSLESSEQNSPSYTDSAVETLNILNHNYERSNSISPPHLEIKQSSASASSSAHRHPSQISAMPSPPTSRYSVSNGISPVTIIDETTSDVPLSGNLMTSSFTPKIEDTCTDSGIYTMDGMLNKTSPIMPERSPIMPEQTSLLPDKSSIMTEQSRSLMSDQSTPIMTEQSRSMLRDQSTPIMTEQSRSMVRDQSAPMMTEQRRSMLRDQSVPIMNESSRSMLRDQPLLSERTATTLSEQVPDMPIRIASVKSNSVLNGNAQPVTSSLNKLYPNIDMSSKNLAANGPWLFNQEAEGIAFENWLGDVFYGDNLTPGLSLPQKNTVYLKNE